jgi:hypothetical protein
MSKIDKFIRTKWISSFQELRGQKKGEVSANRHGIFFGGGDAGISGGTESFNQEK